MGKITDTQVTFKSAKFIYDKIKRQFSDFANANLLDSVDFPDYTAEVLKELGYANTYLEEDAVLLVKNNKAKLPKEFRYLYAAYKCNHVDSCSSTKDSLQNSQVYYNTITCETFNKKGNCEIDYDCKGELLEKVTIRQFVKEGVLTHNFRLGQPLQLSPNVREHCAQGCINVNMACADEITISNGSILTNFCDGDIYIQYYAFPFDENGEILIPDIPFLEKTIELYIKWQLLLNFWLVGSVADIQNKWGAAQQLYEQNLAEVKFEQRLPTFAKLVNSVRTRRAVNAVTFFSQHDKRRYY